MKRISALLNLIISTIVLSLIAVLISPLDKKGKIINRLGRIWAIFYLYICHIKIRTRGVENIIEGPCVYMCNHQSVLDIFAIYVSLNVPFKWIAKKELFSIPFLGWALKAGRHIEMDRKNPVKAIKSLKKALVNLKNGINIVIFPEGTWGKGDRLLPFKKGGFDLALKAGVPIIPVGIKGTRTLQPEGYNVPIKKGTIEVNIGRPIYNSKGPMTEIDSLMDSVKKELEALIYGTGS